jgi:hypothetical protein
MEKIVQIKKKMKTTKQIAKKLKSQISMKKGYF